MITLSIDCLLIDKARLKDFKKKDGKMAKYAELILIPTPNSDYGDFIVKQSVTKEEREAGKQLPILGNAKYLERRSGGPSAKHSAPAEKEAFSPGDPTLADSEVPF